MDASIRLFAVTVRLKKNPNHDPKNKQTGPCPVPPHQACDDVTGEHHTMLITGGTETTVEIVRALLSPEFHVTRVEKLTLPPGMVVIP